MISFEKTINMSKNSDNFQEQEKLLERAKKTASLGRSFMVIDNDRNSRGLNEIYSLRREGRLVSELMPDKFDTVSSVDIKEVNNTEDKALGLAIITATQLLEQRKKPSSLIEDSKSLEQLIKQLGESSQLLERLDSTRPDDVKLIIKKILLARGVKEETIADVHIEKLKGAVLQARESLIRKNRRLKDYLGK